MAYVYYSMMMDEGDQEYLFWGDHDLPVPGSVRHLEEHNPRDSVTIMSIAADNGDVYTGFARWRGNGEEVVPVELKFLMGDEQDYTSLDARLTRQGFEEGRLPQMVEVAVE